jgi:hypothetical protein
MRSEDQGLGIRTPQGQLLISKLCFARTDVCLDIGWARDPLQQAHHRRLLQPWWWLLPDPPVAPPKGPAIDAFFNLNAAHCRSRRQRPPGTNYGKLSLLGVLQARHFMRFFSDPCGAKDSKKTTMNKISSNIIKTEFIYKTKVSVPQVEVRRHMCLQAGSQTAQLQASQFPRR